MCTRAYFPLQSLLSFFHSSELMAQGPFAHKKCVEQNAKSCSTHDWIEIFSGRYPQWK